MRKEEFAEVLGEINGKHILEARAERRAKKSVWIKWGAMAACFCLLAAVHNLFQDTSQTPPDNNDFPVHDSSVQTDPNQSEETQNTEDSHAPWTIHYNEVSSMIAANRAFIKGSFTEPLNDAELAALLPGADLACSGYARFDDKGNLLDIEIQAETTMPGSPVTIGLADYIFGFDYVLSGTEVMSVCNGLDYRVYQYQTGNKVELSAYAIINDIYFAFAMDAPQEELEQAKEAFRVILECFACYEEGKPDLSAIAPKEIPELTEVIFSTLSEAQAEPDFGRYLPSELPDGFGDAMIRRFRFQDSNYLSGMWSRGMDDLTWVIEPYSEDDAHRLTSVDDRENYDLSLYPIPRADSVPDELREVVDDPIFEADELTLEAVYCRAYKVDDAGDTDGWRMRFSVRYGDVIVSVNTKGVAPEWLYQQLMILNGQ